MWILQVRFSFDDIEAVRCFVSRGFLVCYSKVPLLFCYSVFFCIDWWASSSNAILLPLFFESSTLFCTYWKKTLITSEDQSVRYQFFLYFNCLLVFSSVYSKKYVLKKPIGKYYCTCAKSPVGAEFIFLVGGNYKKTWTFWDALISWTWCSIFFQMWTNEVGGKFYFTSLFWWIVALFNETIFSISRFCLTMHFCCTELL